MRLARAVAVGYPHHITQRGNFAQDVFFTDGDRLVYLEWLLECAKRHGVRIDAYCLMTNHVHFLAVPAQPDSFARCFSQVHMRHARRLNRRALRAGHLWQGRFYSCVLDEFHAWAALRYIECNPLRAALVTQAEAYPWSSAAAHCGLKTDPLVSGELPSAMAAPDWSQWLAGGEPDDTVRLLRANTHTGRPCGTPAFVQAMEIILGRALTRKPAGRPHKNQGQI